MEMIAFVMAIVALAVAVAAMGFAAYAIYGRQE